MDPNTTLKWIEEGLRAGESVGDHVGDLACWLDRGGFAPDWQQHPKAARAFWKAYPNHAPRRPFAP